MDNKEFAIRIGRFQLNARNLAFLLGPLMLVGPATVRVAP